MKTLVAYFSHIGETEINRKVVTIEKGHTEIVAEKIANKLNADLFKIEPAIPYPSKYEDIVIRARQENEDTKTPEIAKLLTNIDEYEVIYLGFPIWYRTYPRIINSFLNSYDFKGKIIRPFCTNDEGSFGIAMLELGSAAKGANVRSGLAIHGSEVKECDEKIEKWLEM